MRPWRLGDGGALGISAAPYQCVCEYAIASRPPCGMQAAPRRAAAQGGGAVRVGPQNPPWYPVVPARVSASTTCRPVMPRLQSKLLSSAHARVYRRRRAAERQRKEEAQRCAWARRSRGVPRSTCDGNLRAPNVALRCLAPNASSHAALTLAATVVAGLPSANARRRRSGALGASEPPCGTP